MDSPKLTTVTLGCKVNQYETQFVRQALLGIGYRDAAPDEPADLCLVNTCTVTTEGDAKSRQIIRRLSRRHPGSHIVVMGCYATRAPVEVAALPGVTEVIYDKRELPDWLNRCGVVDVPSGISNFGGRQRAYVKVQDGCLLRCSFCIIPYVRPPLSSRPLEPILEECRRLVDGGYREIVLTGIHLGHYGVDFNRTRPKSEWVRLSHLVDRIVCLPGDFRVRLSSIEATEVTKELIEVMAQHNGRVAPHLHISMQSGADAVLRRMRRRWGSRRFVDRCQHVQEALDQPALTTDVIVGFPGETPEDFDQTCRVVREVGFSKIHIFPFSPRQMTPAAEMSGQIPKREKRARQQHLAGIGSGLRERYFRSLQGKVLRVLVESRCDDRPGVTRGMACRYAPVMLPIGWGAMGELVNVTAGGLIDGVIQGTCPAGSPHPQ